MSDNKTIKYSPNQLAAATLAHCPQLTPRTWATLRGNLGSDHAITAASYRVLCDAGATDRAALAIVSTNKATDMSAVERRLSAEHIAVLLAGDTAYPPALRELHDPPQVLFVRGTLPAAPACPVAVVGTRRVSTYGKTVLPPIVQALARAGCTIISGLALGIDGIAHAAALDANATTIAVVATGVDRASTYPPRHRALAERIIERGGAMVSEYPPGTKGLPHQFPARNRIVAALAQVTLVCEAPMKSGALITARCALELSRDVGVIPGSITHPNQEGAHFFIQNGAALVTSADDVLALMHMAPERRAPQQDSAVIDGIPHADVLLPHLDEPRHNDMLIEATGLTAEQVMSTLVMMEMRGLIKQLDGGLYVRAVL